MAVFTVEGAARIFPRRFRRLLGKSKRRCLYKPRVDGGEGSLLILLLPEPSGLTPLGHSVPFCLLTDKVKMASTPSFLVSSFSSSLSSLSSPVPPPREERHRSNDSSGNQSVPESSSSGMMTRAEAKVLQALEVIKSLHDFDSTICLESLRSVQKCFSIPNEYVLHALKSGQRPYHPCPGGFDISIDALEAGLRFPLHPVIGECLNWWRVSPDQIAPNSWGYIITFLGECQGVPKASRKRRGGDSVGQKKKDRCRSPHKADRASKGKRPADTSVEHPAPRQRPKSMRELCSARADVDGRNYHAIRMCNLLEQASDAPLDPDLRPLTHGTLNQHYQATLFDRVHDASRVIISLDGKMSLLCQELQDLKEGGNPDAVAAVEVRAVEAQSVAEHLRIKLDEANNRRASAEAELEKSRSESTSFERQLADLRERLGDSEGQLQSARARVHQMETELLDLARSKEALREDLSKRVIEEYKELPEFEMSLVQMGRVSLEYGYQLALTRL
ncbi:hypothetical protein BHM03_00051330 [Ensete ventricosum]|nr:hypothetical protein BHM03_00051330 [Ensete ventricosum]